MTYTMFRIIGNEIPGRHAEGQNFRNLEYILENEIFPENCMKVFVLNRIYDQDYYETLRNRIVGKYRNVVQFTIPFEVSEFNRRSTDIGKLKYLTNINGARNECLTAASPDEVALVLDGNCFFTPGGWRAFDENVRANSRDEAYAIRMSRIISFTQLDPHALPRCNEEYYYPNGRSIFGLTEPQLAFNSSTKLRFDEELLYGDCDKAEMLVRLGFPGIWDQWYRKPVEPIEFFGKTKLCGWCYRLPSGNDRADQNNMERAKSRMAGLSELLKKVQEVCV
jgi:hypothetical protein